MRLTVLSSAIITALCTQNPALAEDKSSDTNITLSGVVEIEAAHSSPYAGPSSSDISVATLEFGVEGRVNEEVSAEIVLLHEEDDEDTNFEVDVATLNYRPKNSNWSVVAGQTFVPFGSFESNMVSDPFTLEMGETRESALQANYESGNLATAFYLFNGSNKQNSGEDESVDNYGINLTYKSEGDVNFTGSIGYINDIGDSDGLQDTINATLGSNDILKHIAGTSVSAIIETGKFNFIAEYIAATEHFTATEINFNGLGAKPSAINVEAGYGFELSDNPATFAVAYQSTDEALALGLAESRTSAVLAVDVMENTALALEISQDKDYEVADGGTGETARTITAQLAIEF